MKSPLSVLLASAFAWLVSSGSAPAGESGRALLAEIMDKPGAWNQMCAIPGPLAFDVSIPVFSGSLVGRHFNLGSGEVKRLQASRSEVIPALVDVLKALDLARAPSLIRDRESEPSGGVQSGLKADWLNPLHLQIIHELNAIEVLAELLRLEAQLHGLLEAAGMDVKAPLPPLDLDAPAFFTKPGDHEKERSGKWWQSAEYKRDEAIFTCRVVQRELLGTMTLLLQREEFAPAIEMVVPLRKKEYEKRLEQARKDISDAEAELRLAEITGGVDEVPDSLLLRPREESAREVLRWRQSNLKALEAGGDHVAFFADYTPALRQDIRAMAQAFLKSVPPERRRGAEAMPKHKEKK